MKKYVNTDITALTVRKKCALVERMAIVLDYLLYYVVEFVVQDFFWPEGSIHEMECGGDEFFCPEGSSRRERVLLGGDIGPDNHDKGAK